MSRSKKKQQAAEAAQADEIAAAEAIAADAPKKKCRKLRKLVLLAVIGGIVAAVVNEDVRKTALDALFGAEEEFQYTSSPASSSNGAS